jgi:hypothetical protein
MNTEDDDKANSHGAEQDDPNGDATFSAQSTQLDAVALEQPGKRLRSNGLSCLHLRRVVFARSFVANASGGFQDVECRLVR